MPFEFALARNGGLNPLAGQVLILREKVLDQGRVKGVHVGMKDCFVVG